MTPVNYRPKAIETIYDSAQQAAAILAIVDAAWRLIEPVQCKPLTQRELFDESPQDDSSIHIVVSTGSEGNGIERSMM